MTNAKNTKRALVSSLLALVLCVSMLIGSTYAWFTDTATTGVNTIQSGTLDVDLVDINGKSLSGETLKFVAADGNTNILWEPGCTYELNEVYVANKGNLALKYKIVINGIQGTAKLLEAIDWTVEIGGETADLSTFEGHLTPGQKSEAIVLIGKMDKNAGNEYQGLTAEGISITVYATQDTVENDSIDNTYDADATYADTIPVADVMNTGAMKVAAKEGSKDGADVTLDLAATYKFKANATGDYDTYKTWIADYVVSFDKDVTDVALAGQYDYYSNDWIAFPGISVKAGEVVRLLKDGKLGTFTYEDICIFVKEFNCGVADPTGANEGTTMKVSLRLYNPAPTDPNTEADYLNVGTYYYTFGKELPVPQVSVDGPKTVDVKYGDKDGATGTLDLATSYTFSADASGDDEYKTWLTDYVVTFDKDVTDIALVGQYDYYDASWIAFPLNDIKANSPIALLEDGIGEEFTYEDICIFVKTFQCGVADTGVAETGTTMTVELRLTNPVDGEIKTVGTYSYTF